MVKTMLAGALSLALAGALASPAAAIELDRGVYARVRLDVPLRISPADEASPRLRFAIDNVTPYTDNPPWEERDKTGTYLIDISTAKALGLLGFGPLGEIFRQAAEELGTRPAPAPAR